MTFVKRNRARVFSVLALLLCALTMFSACQEPQQSIPGSVDSISVRVMDGMDSKTITPEGNVNISHYVITVVNEAEGINQSSGYLTKGSMFTVSNVPAGTWYAKVDAYIDRGEATYVKVASDQSEPKLVESGEQTTLEVVLDTLDAVASGDVTVTLKMPVALSAESTAFWYQYTITGMTDEEFTHTSELLSGTTGADGLATITLDAATLGLMQGAYRFEITVQDKQNSPTLTRKGVDVMRLVNGLEAKGTIDLSSYESDQSFNVTITNKIGDILTPEIQNGQEVYSLVDNGVENILEVTLATPLTDGQVIEWYVDGELDETVDDSSSSEGKYVLVFEAGSHNVTAIVRDVNTAMAVGSINSFKISFISITEQIFTFVLNDDGQSYTVTGLAVPADKFEMPEDGVLEIPATYQGKPVTKIGYEAFSSRKDIVGSVVIPEGVESIGISAFSHCSLTDINIPESMVSIGHHAFYSCSELVDIIIPGNVRSIEDFAFYDCSSLESITIPDSVISIGGSAFCGCSALASITIPKGVISIGPWAFSGCTSLASIILPESISTIETNTFNGCSSLESINLPEGIKTIGMSAFEDCSKLRSITIPEGVLSIETSAFSFCTNLASVTLPESLTSIGNHSFLSCFALSNIMFPESVTTIEEPFPNCSELTDIYCEVVSRPEGWSSYWGALCHPDIFWGVSRSEYDAIMNNDSVPYDVAEPVVGYDSETVTLSCDTSFAHIYYTLDGSEPDKDSTLYTEPFRHIGDFTLKAVAYVGNGIYSDVVTKPLSSVGSGGID